jgi:hypothetical protein
MSKITIDDTEYDLDALPKEAIEHLKSIRFVDSELARIQGQAASLQTARMAYSIALRKVLNNDGDGGVGDLQIPENISFE